MEKQLQHAKSVKLSINKKEYIIFIISLLFVFIFSYTAIDKLHHLEKFSRGVSKIHYVGGMAMWIG